MQKRQADRAREAKRTGVRGRARGAAVILAVVASVVLVTVLAYHDVPDYFFTGMDSLTLIETGRVGSTSDLQRTLTTPLMDGTAFTRVLKYYRPLTSLSYSIDYLVWGLNALGYHAVDLALHMIVCVLVFFMTSALSGGRGLAAWLSCLLFAAHPIHVEVVPVIANRQDVLASAFLMLSLVTFIRHTSTEHRTNRHFYLSLVFYVLALASKELAVLLPCLVLAYALIFTGEKSLAGRAVGSLKAVAGFAVVTVAWFGWRAYVLGGFGGYVGGMVGTTPAARDLGRDARDYFLDLVYPLGDIIARSLPLYILLAACFVFAVSVAIAVLRARTSHKGGLQARYGKGSRRVNAPREEGGAKRQGISDQGRTQSGVGASLAWLAVWLVVPLVVSLWTGTFSHRNMYFPSIALCVLMSLVIVGSAKFFRDLLRSRRAPRARGHLWLKGVNAFNLAFAGVVAVSLFLFSPVVHGCSDWQAASNAASLLLEHLDSYSPTFKDGARLEFQDLPSRVSLNRYRTDKGRFWFYQAREMSVLSIWSLNSWLKLTHPEKDLKAVVLSRAEVRYLPVKVEFEVSQSSSENSVKIRPVYYVIMD